jgi:hypothetical protein
MIRSLMFCSWLLERGRATAASGLPRAAEVAAELSSTGIDPCPPTCVSVSR